MNTAVVTSFWPRFHSKNDFHGVFHVELYNEISRELDEVFTNGQVNGVRLVFVGSSISDQLSFWVNFPFKTNI